MRIRNHCLEVPTQGENCLASKGRARAKGWKLRLETFEAGEKAQIVDCEGK